MSGSLSDTNLSSVYRYSGFLPASSILHAALGEAIGASEENALGEEVGKKEDEALGDEHGNSEEKALGDELGKNEDDLGEEDGKKEDALGDEDGNKEDALGDEVGKKPETRGEEGGTWVEARRFEKSLESSFEGCLAFKDSPQHEHLSVSIVWSSLLLSVTFFSGFVNVF